MVPFWRRRRLWFCRCPRLVPAIPSAPEPEMGELGQNVPGMWFPASPAGNHLLVEAGGQHIHGFRRGLDYAFIRTLRMRSVLSRCSKSAES
jgi:hypothetical protein